MENYLDDFHSWHRTTQLPIYSDYLIKLENKLLAGDITAQEVHAETDVVQAFMDASIKKLIPMGVHIFSDYSEQQISENQKKLGKYHDRFKKEYIDVSMKKLYRLREKEFKKNFSRMAGSPTKEQEEWIKDWAHSLTPYEKLTHSQQKIWAQDLEKLLREAKEPAALEKGLSTLFLVSTDHWEPELEKILDDNQAKSYALIAKLLNNLTSKQKRKLSEKLLNYAQDFKEIAAEAS